MDESISSFQFIGYQIDTVRLTLNENFQPREQIKLQFDVNADVTVLDPDRKVSKVVLSCVVFPNYRKKNEPFRLVIVTSGIFQFKGDVSVDQLVRFSEVNATAVLFPYLRAAITHITTACNQPPVILPLINVSEYIKQKKRQKEQGEGATD
jgi:preprotein translocase subunit SecB